IPHRHSHKDRFIVDQFINARHDLGWCHRHPFAAVLGQHGIESVAPSATIVAAASPHEHRWPADQWSLALHCRTKNLADEDAFPHGRYSAQESGVSLTRTATTSGQRTLHQSYSHWLMTSVLVRSCPKTSLRCLWSIVALMKSCNAESS